MTSTDLEKRSPEELELLKAQDAEFDNDSFQTPILKIGQPLTKEVQDESAEPGEFINSLTGEGVGDKIGFIVAYYNKGRFATDDGRAFVAFDANIPEAWSDLVGEEFVGTPFTEYPDAEEQFKNRVNAKEIEWGKGPKISTTHNYTGLAVVSAPEGSDEAEELQPVRLSLQRTNMPAVRKLNSIKRAVLRNRPFYDVVFDLATYKKDFGRGSAYLLNPKQGRTTTPEEREEAYNLALAVQGGRVQSVGESDEGGPSAPVAEPKSEGALDV